MANIDDAMDVVQQKQTDARMVETLISNMGQMVRTAPSSSGPEDGVDTGTSVVPPKADTPIDAPPEPTALQKTRGLKADGMPDDVVAGATSGATGDLAAYMKAASGEESGGNPNATNARTGASGTFQIMPANWPSWAKDAGVDPGDHSAQAQQKVAGHKMQEYYDQFGSWGAVAVAWYAGPGAAARWVQNPHDAAFNVGQGPKGSEPSINAYVANILGQMKAQSGAQQ